MSTELPLFPEQASTSAARGDHLYFFLLATSGLMAVLIFLTIAWFAVKYRRRSEKERAEAIVGSVPLELLWTLTPLVVFMGMFVWGARLYFSDSRPPPGAEEVWVVGKQWMWKIQHVDGQREINELHVPVGKPIQLTMTSEDVIHSFYVPAFRIKHDVLPGRYARLWFQATKTGTYHLFCSEYCGTKHSGMIGSVVVMQPLEYERWLSGASDDPPAVAGERLFVRLGCSACHPVSPASLPITSIARGPALQGLVGRKVQLQGGQSVTADEDYIRESILDPNAKVVAGYQPVMPTFKGLVTEEGLMQLVAYLKSLSVQEGAKAEP